MIDFKLKTPVVLLIFNRPDTTEILFEAVRSVKPTKLLVIADGPRLDNTNDFEKCKATRLIVEKVDWDCKVMTNYSETNLGCKNRISTGLNWVFSMFEEAIILEDDCLPHLTFFRFCSELLDYYRHDNRVMVISGNNFQFGNARADYHYSYYFSRYPHCWGWATWGRAWKSYDAEIKLWQDIREGNWLSSVLEESRAVRYWTKIFQDVYDNNCDSWAYPLTFACWVQRGLTILPKKNLVSNIGFREDGTHTVTTKSKLANVPTEDMVFPLKHPNFMIRDDQADKYTEKIMFSLTFAKRFKHEVKSRLQNLYRLFKK